MPFLKFRKNYKKDAQFVSNYGYLRKLIIFLYTSLKLSEDYTERCCIKDTRIITNFATVEK